MKILLIALLILFSTPSFSIINGQEVSRENPLSRSVVSLFALDHRLWITNCTGIVLSDKAILTAAHCVDKQHPENMLVNFSIKSPTYPAQQYPATRVDAEDIPKIYEVRKVKSYKMHPDYNLDIHDIAVILLEDKIPSQATPVKLLPDQYINLAYDHKTTLEGKIFDVTLLGFGLTNEDTIEETDVLRMATVRGKFEDQFLITDQTQGSGACDGDSGGPAFVTLDGGTYLVGVTHGPNTGSTTCHEEGQFTDPGLYKEFLKQAELALFAQ